MRLLKKILAIAGISLLALSAVASPADPKNGVDYLTLAKAQPTDSVKKVEVLEFFGYFCPHCDAFEPSLSQWVKKQGDNIVFKRVPIAFNEKMVPQQQMYYALEAMGKLEELHGKIFYALHNERKALYTEAEITDFLVKQGLDKKTFSDTYHSFAVQTKTRRATQMQSSYNINSVPTLVVDGRYVTSPSIVGTSAKNMPEPQLQEGALKVMDALVAKANKERSQAGAAESGKKSK